MPVGKRNRFLLLYGSQTGQAEAITEEIRDNAATHGLDCDRHCLSQTEKKFSIENESCIVIVTSTTGDGEPPDTALKFFRRLKKKTLPNNYLSTLNYALLGLGDSNYTNFCNAGKTLDKRLEDLGAKRFYQSGWADDAVGLEVVVEPWMEGLFPALQKLLSDNSGHCMRNSVVDSSVDTVECGQTNTILKGSENCQNQKSSTNGHHFQATNGHIESISENGCEKCKTNSESGSSENYNPGKTVKDQTYKGGDETDSLSQNKGPNVKLSQNSNTENSSNSSQRDKLFNPSTPQSNGPIVNISSSNDRKNESQQKSDLTPTSAEGFGSNSDSKEMTAQGPESTLIFSIPPLCESAVSVPLLPAPFLTITYHPEESLDAGCLTLQNGHPFPSASTPVTKATISSVKVLTAETCVKKALKLGIAFQSEFKYLPGDSISICCENDSSEVDLLLDRLGVIDKADVVCHLDLMTDTKKKKAAIPSHISPVSTLRYLFTSSIDIRETPKKAVIRMLVEYTCDQCEKRRLQELCSKQGMEDYNKHIRNPELSIFDIFKTFRTCHPPVERLIELLPRLQPRPYSACSSPLRKPKEVEVVFNIVEIPDGDGRCMSRRGVCTGMLDKVTKDIQQIGSQSISKMMSNISLEPSKLQVKVFGRTNQNFHLPEDVSVPIIMIGPGTGVAPFVGFLQHRQEQCIEKSFSGQKFGDAVLFFGCRNRDKDFLFREELENFVRNGTLSKMFTSFSRDEQESGAPRYVQDNISINSEMVFDLIDKQKAIVYVCGDAKNMAKDVNQAFMGIVQKHKGVSELESEAYMKKMRLHKQYFEDVWT